MDSVSFINLQSNGNSAFALDGHLGTAIFSNLGVAGCTTDTNSPFVLGAGVNQTPGSFKFENCFFEGNKEINEHITGASDISLNGDAMYASKGIFVNCWTSSGQPSLSVNGSKYSDWIVTNEVIHVANATGEDKMFCWVPGSRCQTMTDVIGNRLGPWYVGKIAMGEGEYRETKLGMKNQTLVVEGSGKTKTTMIDGGSSETLFIITTGQLTASKIQFVPSASSHLITLSDDGTVSISDSCVETVGANVKLSKAVFSVSAGTLRLTGVDCSSLSFTETTVLFLFSSLTRSLTLTNSSFSSISSGGSGSCICSTITTGQSVSIGEEGGSDSFSSCSSVGDGGALNVKLMDTGSLRIVSTHFSDCSSDGIGGGVFLELDSTTSQTTWSLDLSGASFGTDIAKNSATKGSNLFVSGKFFETVVTPSIFPSLSETEEGDMWGVDSNTTVSSSLLVYLMPFSNTAIVGGSNAFDIDDCGHFGVGCVSIQNALDQVKTSESESLVLSFESGATLRESFSFETSQTVFFESASDTPQSITVEAQGRFSVSSGTLSLNTLTFTTTVPSFLSSLISLNGGSLSVTKCTFSGFSSSLKQVVSGSIGTGQKISIVDTLFESCTASSGTGIVELSVDGDGEVQIEGSSGFEECTLSENGHLVVIDCSDLAAFVSKNELPALKPLKPTDRIFNETEKLIFWGKEGNGKEYSLLFVWFAHTTGDLHVHSDGEDDGRCGEDVLPCSSLSHAMDKMKNGVVLVDSAFAQTSPGF
ncbi:hypothetical protein BLNAU_1412 [Blattamonas nauphoetae]|uniref:Uncharacterized protein n=1 Tax=Blattamonas nauphoetae TaxID=2049346 RepID=A0ABQ9YJB1_9EUKA|nr:hypothetical protein BLNAU_1412 [Blattamonas nauphoetae]